MDCSLPFASHGSLGTLCHPCTTLLTLDHKELFTYLGLLGALFLSWLDKYPLLTLDLYVHFAYLKPLGTLRFQDYGNMVTRFFKKIK